MMPSPNAGAYHVLRFQDGAETDAFVRALQRYLDSPRGGVFLLPPRASEVWAPVSLRSAPLEIYLSNDALEAARNAFAPVPVAETRSADRLPEGCVLIMRGAKLKQG